MMSKLQMMTSEGTESDTDMQAILEVVKQHIDLNCAHEQEFKLPDDYLHDQENQTDVKFEFHDGNTECMHTNNSELGIPDNQRLHKAVSELMDVVCNQNMQDFNLPYDYLHNTKNKKHMHIEFEAPQKESGDTTYSEQCTEDNYKLHKAVLGVMEELRYQCSVIRDFDLPFDYFLDHSMHNDMKGPTDSIIHGYSGNVTKKSTMFRKRHHRTKSNRTNREKDKQRKRKERLLKKQTESQFCEENLCTDNEKSSETIWQKMYRDNLNYQQNKKLYSKQKYKEDVQYQQGKKDASKTKYSLDSDFQQQLKIASKTKYKYNVHFQQEVQHRSRTKYKHNLRFQQEVRNRSRAKYQHNLRFQQEVRNRSRIKYRHNLHFQQKMRKAMIDRYASDIDFREKMKTLNLLRYRENVLIREKSKQRLREQYKCELVRRQRKISLVQQRRLKGKGNIATWFKQQVRDGPQYICSVCHKFKFRKQVVKCDPQQYSKKGAKSLAMANKCITRQFVSDCTAECPSNCKTISHKQWICYTCHRNILKAKMPVDAYANGLQLPSIPNELKSLNNLEKQLISLRIPFMKLVQLPKGNQRGIIGPCVSVPTDIEKTTDVLPRCNDETQLIRCKLKRKLSYKGHSQYEFVSTKKISKALECLTERNPYYQDKSLNQTWIDNIPSDFEDITAAEEVPLEISEEEEDISNEQDDNVSSKDKGLPSDTCLQPVDIGQEILDQHFDNIFCVAPAEGKTPVRMMQEEGNEAMSFPSQFPEGSFGTYDAKRPVRLTRSRYFHTRLLSADSRFSSDSSYIFYAQYLAELEQVMSKVSVAMRKSSGKDGAGNTITASMLTDRNQLKNLLTTDQGYKFLTPIRGTPPYWQTALNDLMATIRQLGIPTFFATFSAADMRWTDILEVLLQQQKSTELLENLDWTAKANLLRNNPVMTAVMFDQRFSIFLKEVIIKRKVIGKVTDHFHRIEFQQRGSPHAHCLFWIQDAPLLDKDDDQAVCDFVDRYVSCELPDENVDPELYEIVSSVQQHSKSHSKSCKKKGTTCRFNFPRPPSEGTFISRSQSLTDPSVQQSPMEMKANAQRVLQRLWNVIQNEKIQNITARNLFTSVGITQKEFEEASNILTKRTNVTLRRKPCDIWINQYNTDLLRCWNANMDIQYITDPYSCVMYIISYISKAEREMGVVLENARKEAAEGNCNAQEAMKKIGGAYFRQREVGAQEAAYRVCGLHLKESSRKVQFVPAGNNQVKMSLPLNAIRMKAGQSEDKDIWMVSLYDRYKARPASEEFDCLCYASFCSEYRVLSASQVPKKPSQSQVFKLQNDLGYIKKRSRTDSAVIRYPRFSVKKNPELYYQSSLQLFLPHRTEKQLKPKKFKTYEEMFLTGAVVLKPSTVKQIVKTIVESNRKKFEKSAEELDQAHEFCDKQDLLEDAWALIAPEAESERLEGQLEKEHLTNEDSVEIPELDTSRKKNTKGTDIEIRQTLFTTQEMQTRLRQLNTEQKSVFYTVRQWCLDKANGKNPEPLRIFIHGGAGTGKSHLIKCLYYEGNKILSPCAPNPDDIVVLLTAPTAVAAFNIGGTTLHQAFALGQSLPLPYIYKRDNELNKLRCKLQNLNILIIDEISMVGQRLLLYVSERLRQIKQTGNALFGNTCIIAVGDLYQLPPVMQFCLHDQRPEHFFPLWSSNFSLVTLEHIMRQKNDTVFAQLLNRLRVKKKTEPLTLDDRSILQSCEHHTVPSDTLHIFGTNAEVDKYNSDIIPTICEVTETLIAQDHDRNPQTGRLTLRDTPYDTTHKYLPKQLIIGPKARVMLIRNVDISCGLVNGAMGTVTELLPRTSNSHFPPAINVLFDNENIRTSQQPPTQPRQHRPIKIKVVEENLQNNAVRHQFPLQLAWACTAHKVQGITTDKLVVGMKHFFGAGMAYVALSRVTSLDGLVIKDFDEHKIFCNEEISDALERMPHSSVHQHNHKNMNANQLTILLHNIQGLIPHIEDMRANSDIANADFICLTETWMDTCSVSPSLENFTFLNKPRSLSYSSTKDIFKTLKNKKHGGVGIYVRKHQKYCQLTFHSLNIECIAVNIKEIKTNLLLIYKPESYTTSIFLEELHQVLLALPQDDSSTIVLGDFNQDIQKSNSSVKHFMEQHLFTQLVDKPTTDGGTLIDHVYLRGKLQISLQTIQTYYSYHNMVMLKIGLP